MEQNELFPKIEEAFQKSSSRVREQPWRRHDEKTSSRRDVGRAVGKGTQESAPGWVSALSAWCQGPASPRRRRAEPSRLGSLIWGSRQLVAAASAASRAVPRQTLAAPCPGPGDPASLLRCSHQALGAGTRGDVGGRESRSQK